ncbi:response regulator [Actomonas aquatica]|uniref:Response regulator transcription factor n=1 Tax=Actomonas aquatica TaxID=2866162 RepID=A0ABZ1C5S7_9BACT|nr:response regulator transcription factor [Opitutus sp. WL0086]WRQ85650.1 response regulator transcription factor [Opitutus sp. WL0086]
MPFPATVLIVDDEPHVRRFLSMLLEDTFEDATVTAVGSGQEAVASYTAQRPDLVLLDINMVGMDGLETLQALRAADPTANVVMVTSVDVRRAVETALTAGARGYILKDTPMDELAASLRSIVEALPQSSSDS